jgi:ABC-type uncharacterized transport system permease subunit
MNLLDVVLALLACVAVIVLKHSLDLARWQSILVAALIGLLVSGIHVWYSRRLYRMPSE